MERLTRCGKAVPGWHCTRAEGHDGPCAAEPDRFLAPDHDEDWESVARAGMVILWIVGICALAIVIGGVALAAWLFK